MATCSVCGRTLKSPRSIAAGVGPVCGRSGGKKRHRARASGFGGSGGYDNGVRRGHAGADGNGIEGIADSDGASAENVDGNG